tara:strand:- start:333 stop:647 length:315 start_codon:yes stop_codon:yes gene_type:complete
MKLLNVGLRITVAKKIDNLKDLEIWSDLNFLTSIVSSQLDKRKSENLQKMSESLIRVVFYFQEYSNNMRLYKKALLDYRLQKNRAIERARKAEKELEQIKNKTI